MIRFTVWRGGTFSDWVTLCALAVCGGWVLLALLAVVTYDPRDHSGYLTMCHSNQKQLSRAMQMYAYDYDERMPPAGAWQAGLDRYTRTTGVLICPSRPKVLFGFAFNQVLDRQPLEQITQPDLAPLLYDSSLGVVNASDRMESFLRPHLLHKQGNIAFEDGHVKSFETPPHATDGISSVKKAASADET